MSFHIHYESKKDKRVSFSEKGFIKIGLKKIVGDDELRLG